VTANWSGIIENSTSYQNLQQEVGSAIKREVLPLLEGESPESEEQFVGRYEKQLELLPFSRRDIARQALLRAFKRLFGEAPERKQVVAELVLNIFEYDRYWIIARRLDEIEPENLIKIAEVLRDWGLGDVAEVATRAKQRLTFLDHFERLATASDTLEFKGIHGVLETNTWLIGDAYELWVSNMTMRRITRDYARKVYSDSNGRKRPDLLMLGSNSHRLLIELKRPSLEITWQDVAQVKEYRDSLQFYFPSEPFDVLVLGGTASPHMAREEPRVRVSTYIELTDGARRRLDWLLKNLDHEAYDLNAPLQDRLDL
jgi:hypothetical protein